MFLMVTIFGKSELRAQCSPDVTAPQLVCTGAYTLVLDGNGQGSVSLSDIMVSATDNCGIPSVSLSGNTFDCDDVNKPGLSITIIATDGAGNSTSCMVDITVMDNTAPSLVVPASVTYECSLPATQPMATATDGCGLATAGVTFSDGLPSSMTLPYSFTRTFSATDVNGNTATGTQLITVTDTGAPTITVSPSNYPMSQSVSCDVTAVVAPTVTATDACAGSLMVSSVTSSTRGSIPSNANFYNYTLTTTYTADDGAGNSVSTSTEIVVSDMEAPMFTSGLPTSGTISTSSTNPAGACFAAFSADYSSDVTDNCAPLNTLSATYMFIDQATNLVLYSGTGLSVSKNVPVGTYEVLFTVVDPSNNIGSFSYVLTVDDGNAPDAICNSAINLSVGNDGLATLTTAQVDNGSNDDCGPVTLALSRSTFDCTHIGMMVPVVLSVTDGAGNVSTCTTMVTVVDNSNPSAFCQDITRTLDANGETVVTAQDIAAGLIANFDVCGNPTTGLVSQDGVNFSPSVTLDCADGASVVLTLQVTDGNMNTNTCTSTVTLVDSEDPDATCNNLNRDLTVAGSYTLTVADSMAIVAGSSDNCTIDQVTFSRRSFGCDDLNQAVLAANASDTVQIHVTVIDASGNSDVCTSILTLNETTAPAISCIDQTLSLDANGELTVTADQLLAGNIYLSTPGDDSLTTASFTATNAFDLSFSYRDTRSRLDPGFEFGYIINGIPTSLPVGRVRLPRVVTVNLSAGQTFSFYTEARDLIPGGTGGSVWIHNLSTSIGTTIPASAFTFAGNGTAFYADACGPLDVQVGPVGGPYASTIDFDCNDITGLPVMGGGTLPAMEVQLQVVDQAGNTSLCTSSITINDGGAPQVVCVSQTVDLNQTGTATLLASSFDNGSSMDACDGRNITFSFVDAFGVDLGTTLVMTCDSIGTRDIYIAAEDQSGNIGYCQTTAVINDNLGPQLTVPSSLTQDCSESIDPTNTGLATAVDNCDGAVTVTYTDQTITGSRNCRVIRRRFSAVDSRGNISFAFQNITIQDNLAPVFTTNVNDPGYIDPNPVTAECAIPVAVTPAVMDNCDMNVTNVVLDTTDTRISARGMFMVTPSDAAYYNFTVVRTWTATDSCGNTAQRVQTVEVADTQAPVFDASIQTTRQIAMDIGSCSANVNIDLTGLVTDACAPLAELMVSNSAGGSYVAQGTYPAGMHSITFTAEDPTGNTNSITIDFEVLDRTNPTATCNSGINLSLNNQGFATLSVQQLDNGSNDNCGIASYQISQSNFTCADIGFNRVTLTVTDLAGNIATCTTSVIVSETNAPVFSTTPADVTVDCSDNLNDPVIVGAAEALTACGTAATITIVDVTTAGTSDNCRVISRTHTATSPSGLTATYVQEIIVEDNSVPTFDNAPAVADRTQTFECVADPLPVLTASDDCGAQPLVSILADGNTQGSNPANADFYNYTISRTYSASDGCNFASSVTIVYTVEDTEAPQVNISNQTIAADMGACQATVNIDLAALTTDCASTANITFTNDSGIGNGANLINGVLAAGVYTVNYTAADPTGNQESGSFTITIEDQTGPNVICQNVVTTLVNGSASVAASDVLVSSTDNCSAAGNLIYSLDQTTFTAPGDYPVVLTVTDEAGNATTCSSIVTVLAPLTVTAGSASGISGATVQLGINAMNFTSVTGLTGTVSLANLPVADFVNNISYNPIFNASDWAVFVNDDVLTFTYSGTSQVSLPATGANLFMIDVELTGAIGDMTNVIIDGSSTQFSAVQNIAGSNVVVTPATGTPGVITVTGNGTQAFVSGTLSTAGGTAIALADVGYLGTSSGTITTGPAGTFSYSVPLGGSTTVSPFKDINYSNGVDIIDLADLRQHVLTNPAKQINDPYNRIAADVAPDGNINILDIIEVQQTVLDPINYEFTSNTSWRFVLDGQPLIFTQNSTDVPACDESATFNNISANITDVDFTGVKIGDINRTANAASLTSGGVLQGRTANTLEFVVQDQALIAGETYQVQLRTRDFTDVLGYQFTLTLDGSIAALDGVQPGVLAGMSTGNFNLASSELLTHVWDNATEVDYVDGETVFTLTLTAAANGMLSDVLDMNGQLTPALAYGQDRSQWDVDLVFEQVSSTTSILGESFSLSQNRPNPYSGSTLIDFTLPTAEAVLFQVIDVNGRVVLSRNLNGVAGKQTIELLSTELPAVGVYHYQLITTDAAATKSMILTK